jgi:hypothetical protein
VPRHPPCALSNLTVKKDLTDALKKINCLLSII